MLNLTTHRVTSLEDCEAWADARQPARYLQTEVMVYPKETPMTWTGRDGVFDQLSGDHGAPDAGSQAACTLGMGDAERQMQDPEDVHRGPLALILAGFLIGVAAEHRVIVGGVLALLLTMLGIAVFAR